MENWKESFAENLIAVLNWLVSPNKTISRKGFLWIVWVLYFVAAILLSFSVAKNGDGPVSGLILLTLYFSSLAFWTWTRLNTEYGQYFIAVPFLMAVIVTPFFEFILAWPAALLLFFYIIFAHMVDDKPKEEVEVKAIEKKVQVLPAPVKLSYETLWMTTILLLIVLWFSIQGLWKGTTVTVVVLSFIGLGASILGFFYLVKNSRNQA